MFEIKKMSKLEKRKMYDYFCCNEKFCMCKDIEIENLTVLNELTSNKLNINDYCYDYLLVELEVFFKDINFIVEFSMLESDVTQYKRLSNVFGNKINEEEKIKYIISNGWYKTIYDYNTDIKYIKLIEQKLNSKCVFLG